jgi:hypothetical protein
MSFPKWRHGEELERIECGVDFGVISGYFVRLSVQRDNAEMEWVGLTPDEADSLAAMLRENAELTRIQQKEFPTPQSSE